MTEGSASATEPTGCLTNLHACSRTGDNDAPPQLPVDDTGKAPAANRPAQSSEERYEYDTTLACGVDRASSRAGSFDHTTCRALTACESRTPPTPGPLYFVWRKERASSTAPWMLIGTHCRNEVPVVAPPAPEIPSMAQIQQAYRELPFAIPSVSVQPVGNRTLVNLPTFYQANWPATGLRPGDTSAPVQLLSWSVEFQIHLADYDFDFGDGARSGPTTDPGGTFPDGGITHRYPAASPGAQVRVDARLTGRFRANGGPWQDIETIADLQDEPVTSIEVLEARAQLVR